LVITGIDTMFFDRVNASKHDCQRMNYRVQALKTTALVDTETRAILDIDYTTKKHHDTQLGWQVARRNASEIASLAADNGYDWMESHKKSAKRV
jgi:IS5 family transposase